MGDPSSVLPDMLSPLVLLSVAFRPRTAASDSKSRRTRARIMPIG